MGKRNLEDMTEEEARALAMLIDTDGCIYAVTRGRKGGITAGARVGMSGRIPILMVELWGGTIYKRYNLQTKNWAFIWRIGDRERTRVFLKKIKPYLLQKQKQAELALEILDLLDDKPEEYMKQVWELKMEISRLNHARMVNVDINKLEGVY